MDENITATDIKHALMFYFRFQRQWLCASECNDADVMAITDKDVVEVEIKINKYDLWKGEAKKRRHPITIKNELSTHHIPNRFYICVPTTLEEEAKKWVNEINKKYGVIRYSPKYYPHISIAKTAYAIHDYFSDSLKKNVMMRVCSENIGLMKNLITRPTPNIEKVLEEFSQKFLQNELIMDDNGKVSITGQSKKMIAFLRKALGGEDEKTHN